MVKPVFLRFVCILGVAAMLTACESLPGTSGQQGAVIGGVAGATTGAIIGGSEHRALGAVLGGLLGAGGGYVIGAKTGKVDSQDKAGADAAGAQASTNPASTQQAMSATNADLNRDGFVTLDEVVAMKNAGFSDQKMIDYLRTTGQVFELTPEQKKYLSDRGVSENVITQMASINQPQPVSTEPRPSGVVGRPQ